MFLNPSFWVPAASDAWVDRMESACRAIEAEYGVQLDKTCIRRGREGTVDSIADRKVFFRKRLKTRNRWFSLFSGRDTRVTPRGFNEPGCFSIGGNMYLGDESFHVSVSYPEIVTDSIERYMILIGDSLQATNAQYLPVDLFTRLRLAHWVTVFGANAVRHTLDDRTPSEEGLPTLCESTYGGLAPRQPHHLGWLNYWSDDACRFVGFSEGATGLGIMQHSYRTPGGAWMVKLQGSPPAVGDREFIELLVGLYSRFPRVGARFGAGEAQR